jgi:hypothetical protein
MPGVTPYLRGPPIGGRAVSDIPTTMRSRRSRIKPIGIHVFGGKHLVSNNRRTLFGVVAGLVTLVTVGATLALVPTVASAAPATVVKNFSYSGSTESWTVPAGITQISITATGGQGGLGGVDSQGLPTPGGYAGVVSGTMDVTPGQVLTVAVGKGGTTGASKATGNGGGAGGTSPLGSTYAGGVGGNPGTSGSSGAGGGGGAASVISSGSTTIVAAGAGGGGGSGQYTPLVGRAAYSTFTARPDATSTNGQPGLNVAAICTTTCDGGGSGAGGGGVQGGAQGNIEFGTGTYTEWMGYGGYPGQNSTASVSGLGSSYQYYAGNNANGSVSFTYVTGAPDAPTAVGGSAADSAVNLTWTAPALTGQAAITDYSVQYALASNPTSWIDYSDSVSTATATAVTGLTNGTAYIFRVAAISSAGTGTYSTASASISPSGVPSAPTALIATPGDASLSVAFSAAASGSTILDYQYQLGSTGTWVSAGTTTSPVVISGLTNGQSYSVVLRAVSAIGNGATSAPVSGIPQSVPGAPSITSISANGQAASIVFTPGFSGGGTITGYQYQLDSTGGWLGATGTTSPLNIGGLASGSIHTIAIRAVNGAGAGAASQTSTITMPAVPGAPVVGSITPADGALSIAFAPGTTGGSPVTGYQYQLTTGGFWNTTTTMSSPLVVAGLHNGTEYQVSLRAINDVGVGAESAAIAATPASTPGAPSIVGDTVAGADAQLSASFTAPTDDGGAAITGYEYSTDGGATWRARATGTTESPLIIATLSSDGTSPLVNGTEYHVELRALNAMGSGTASAVATGIALAKPSAPTVSAITASASSLAVVFQPGSNGGAAITSWEYRVDNGSWISTGSLATGFVIGGLDNGTAYDISVRGVNSEGNGAASTAVSATPVTLPGQPAIASITRADRSLSVAFVLSSTGGSAVTAWEYTTDGGTTWATATGTTSPLVITALSGNPATRLVNSTAYPVAIRAINAVGTGVASSTNTAAPSTTPSAPMVTLTPLNQSIRVTYSLSGDGGSPVSAIEYSVDGGSTWSDAGSLTSPFTISGLTNGTAYAVRVRADNIVGSGTASTVASTTPRTLPDAPTAVTAASNAAAVDVSWVAPVGTGGSAITGYIASAYAVSNGTTAAATCVTTTATSCSITGLTNETTYYVSVVAQNIVGSGVASSPRVVVTPRARPLAPTITSVTKGNAFLTVNFTAGAAVSPAVAGFEYQLNGGAWIATGTTTSPITISPLTNGTSYAILVRGVNAAGSGAVSNSVSATPYSVPATIDSTTITADARDTSVVVTWPAADDKGSAITQYLVTAWNDPSMGSQVTTCTTTGALTCTLSSLANNTTYWITIESTNAGGLSIRSARLAVTTSSKPGIVATPTAVAANGQVTLSWAAGSRGASAVSDYTITSSANGGGATTFVHSASTATTATITGLTNGTPYTFTVAAVNGSGTGPTSAASTAVIPMAPGVIPSASSIASAVNGYTFTIANYDATLSYTFSTLNGVSVTRNGSAVTVSGVNPGATQSITVTAANAATTSASGPVTGTALGTGTAPQFTVPTRTTDGFTFSISNYDANGSYALTATHGTVDRVGAIVTVNGLTIGQQSSIVVTASHTGFTDAVNTESATAIALGDLPTFSGASRTADGFGFTITNYDSSLDYSFGATNAANVTRSGDHVVVSGLGSGVGSTVTVTATLAHQSTASASIDGVALGAGVDPTAGAVSRSIDGYSFVIDNYSALSDYTVAVTDGTVTRAGATVTVTGLTPAETTTVHIVATRSGFTAASLDVSGAALGTGVTPLFSGVTRTADGYRFDISNFDADASYTFSVDPGISAAIVGSTVTVSGASAALTTGVTVAVAKSGSTTATASQSGTALASGVVPTLSTPVQTADGFSFIITNYAAALVYTFDATAGATVVNTAGSVIVSGVSSATSSTVTVTATDPDVSTSSAPVTATSLSAGMAPILSATASLAGGYSFDISNLSSEYTYTFTVSDGGSAALSGSTVTVTGLAPAVVGTTVVTATRAGFTARTATATGATFGAGSVPSTSPITLADDGYGFDLTNYDADYAYTVTVDHGTVTMTAGSIIVTGLGVGQTATVHIVTAKTGELDETADVTGSSIAAAVSPAFSAPLSTATGFVFTITNYSADWSYGFSATGGATVTADGARVTVGGLSASASAAITVTATRAGFHDGQSSTAGSASTPVVAPAAATPAAATQSTSSPVAAMTTATSSGASNSDASATARLATQPDASELKPGVIIVMVNGHPVKFTVTSTASGLTLIGGDLVLKLSLRGSVSGSRGGGSGVSDGTVTLKPGAHLHLMVKGFRPGSTVGVWTFSTPTLLTQPVVASDLSASDDFSLPVAIPTGKHTLKVSGISAAGAPVSIAIGYIVGAAKHSAATVVGAGSPTGAIIAWVASGAAAVVLAIVLFFILLGRRRRREDEDDLDDSWRIS